MPNIDGTSASDPHSHVDELSTDGTFSPLDWELTVAGTLLDAQTNPDELLMIAAVLARMADENGVVDINPDSWTPGSEEEYMAVLLTMMAWEDGNDPSGGWRLRFPEKKPEC